MSKNKKPKQKPAPRPSAKSVNINRDPATIKKSADSDGYEIKEQRSNG